MTSETATPAATTSATPRQQPQERKVADVWNRHWVDFDDERLAALYANLADAPAWYRRPFVCGPGDELRILTRALGPLRGMRTLEYGSGIGWTSLWLARAGAAVTLADVSPAALELSRRVFARAGLTGEWQQASVFDPSPLQGGYDLVFNSGLVEHFHREQQQDLVQNMTTLTRPGGGVALFAPYSGGRIYVWAKRRMEELGRWRFGDEFPLATMLDLGAAAGLQTVTECTAKPGDQWNFLAGVHPRLARLGKLAHLATLGDLNPFWRWAMGDSMLATVFRRPA